MRRLGSTAPGCDFDDMMPNAPGDTNRPIISGTTLTDAPAHSRNEYVDDGMLMDDDDNGVIDADLMPT